MKSRPLAFVAVALIFATLSTAATAHPGPHDFESVSAAVSHVVGSPDHASWLILAITAVLSILAVKTAIRIASSEKSDVRR